jgi:hypothetical protein
MIDDETTVTFASGRVVREGERVKVGTTATAGELRSAGLNPESLAAAGHITTEQPDPGTAG